MKPLPTALVMPGADAVDDVLVLERVKEIDEPVEASEKPRPTAVARPERARSATVGGPSSQGTRNLSPKLHGSTK